MSYRFSQIPLFARPQGAAPDVRTVCAPLLLAVCLAGAAASAAPPERSVRVSPGEITLELGEGRQFSARQEGPEATLLWVVEPAGAGQVSSSGFYRAPANYPTPAAIRVRASIPGSDVQAASLIFLKAVSVTMPGEKVALRTGETHLFKAKVEGASDGRVTWSVDGGDAFGRVQPSGLYTAPTRCSTPATLTVRATSVADPSKSATTTVQLERVKLRLQPKEVELRLGDSRRFDATVEGTGLDAVEWEVLGENAGQISSSGLYTAPEAGPTPAVYTIVARSAADPSKAHQARVRILPVQIVPRGEKLTIKGRKKRKGGLLFGPVGFVVRSVVRQVTRVYLPFSPLDVVARAPLFQDKEGKQYVPLGGGLVLGAQVANAANDRLKWEIEGPQIGHLSEDGVYRAPDTLTTPSVVQIRMTSYADPSKSVLQTVQIPPVLVQAEKAERCLLDGVTQLKAQVRNSENDRILWSVEGGPSYGTVTETGLYHPPASLTTPAIVRVRATAEADPTKSAVVEVQIPEVKLTVSPEKASVDPGRRVRLRAKVTGCQSAPVVEWLLMPRLGFISPDGVYTAPQGDGPQVVEVQARLKGDPTKTATVSLRLNGPK